MQSLVESMKSGSDLRNKKERLYFHSSFYLINIPNHVPGVDISIKVIYSYLHNMYYHHSHIHHNFKRHGRCMFL